MNWLLRRWGPLGGATLCGVLLTLGFQAFLHHDAKLMSDVIMDEHQDGRLAAVETWQRLHDEKAAPLVERFQKVDRKMDELLLWLRIVAQKQGWPPPPDPAKLNAMPNGGRSWLSEADASPQRKKGSR